MKIKVRAWHKLLEEFVPPHRFLVIDADGCLHNDDVEIIQFTGLTDKNGVEIYDGDIVSVSGTGNAEVKICPAYGVVFSDKDGYERPYVDCVAEQDYPIVIGNIYQNPELLK